MKKPKDRRTCSSHCISGKQHCDQESHLNEGGVLLRREVKVAPEGDISCSPGGKEVEMGEPQFEGETMLANSPSEGSAKPGRSKSSKTNITIKPCKVLLTNIDCTLKLSHKYCLRPPKTKKSPQKIRNAKKIVSFKMLQAGLRDLLNRHRIQTSGNSRNSAVLPENKETEKMESSLLLNSPAKILSEETNIDQNVKKTAREASFPDSSMLCGSVFTKFSFIKSSPENSTTSICHAQEKKEPVMILETQSAVSFEPIEKCVEQGETLIEQTERKESSHRTDILGSNCSGEMSVDGTSQCSRINLIPVTPRDTLQITRTNSAGSPGPSLLCDFEPYLVSSLPDELPRKNTAKRPSEGRRNQYSIQSSGGAVVQGTVEERDALNQTRPLPRKENNDSCWFELEGNEVVNVGDSMYATYEEDLSQKIQNGDHNRDVPLSGCQSFLGDVTNIKHSEVKKETMQNGGISNAEEGNSQPANESLAEEEDRFHQSHGVRIVYYELAGSAVRLLGTPRDSSAVLSLDRIIELEDSSDSEVQTGSHSAEEGQGSSPSLNKESEGSPYSMELTWHQPLYSEDTRAMKSSPWRAKRRVARIRSSNLSQEGSRVKVVDALRAVLQKRLDDSPDLGVQAGAVLRIAKKVEKALFDLSCCVDQHYKNKYRSLLFNLKSAKNQLFCKVILGEISPKRLVQMNSLELAPEDLAEWRASERKHALEVIEKEAQDAQEAPRCGITKFTHKGIIEINRETDEDLLFQEILGSQVLENENSHPEAPAASRTYCRESHQSHMSHLDCFSDTGQMAAEDEGGFKPPTRKRILKQETNVSKCLQSNVVYSDGGERRLQEDSTVSPSFPKKPLQVGKQSRTSVIWKGLIQMFSLKQFAAEAYPVYGSGFQGLPDLLQSKGCILPEDVWAYLDSIWPANIKETALIRFHPSLPKGRSPYNMLYSYLNNKQRYGIVAHNRMEMFMVPLAAYQPVPSKLHPMGGPGLDPCHPSLLLGLILPKRPPTGPDPLPKTKRKSMAFKDNIEIQYFPLSSEVDAHQIQPPQPLSLSDPLWGQDGLAAALPRLVSKVTQAAGGGPSQSFPDSLQLQSGSLWIEGQLNNMTLETSGAQSQQSGICTNPGPLYLRDFFGLVLPSEIACPNHQGVDATHRAHLLDASPETMLSAEAAETPFWPQIPGATPVAGDTDSLVGETLSLIRYMTQLQSHVTPNQDPPPSFLLCPFSAMPLETTSASSPVATGLEFPVVQQGADEVSAQLQLLLSLVRGQTQTPST
ncbi:SPOC domain-containing protein 1 isoform X2 [Paroedura picta]|uniref:SPOC domain-containing protein 1 isoform X2 n=1 Tax=Paroedura picta TaxID=143630 RepID=UPI00405700EC